MAITRIIGEKGNYLFDPDNNKTLLRENGKFGNVYAGFRESDNVPVIIKQLNPALLQHPVAVLQFKFEADVELIHPHLRKTFEFISVGSNNFLIQEYIKGHNLKYFIHRQNKVNNSISFIVQYIINILDALEYIHAKNIIHCDIKPSNILIEESHDENKVDINNPPVKLIDFGNAKTPLAQFLTTVKPFSMIYSPPEQVLHAYDLINPSSDLFALAITAYELIAGKFPYPARHPEMLLHLQVSGEIEENEKIPDELFSIFKKATARKKFPLPPSQLSAEEQHALILAGIKQRYSSAAEMKNDLIRFRQNFRERKNIFTRLFN